MISASTLLTPSADASWHVWKSRASAPSEAIDSPADYSDRSKPTVVGLPASACRTLALVLPQADPILLQQMVASQLERRGLRGTAGGPPQFRWQQLAHMGPHALVAVDVLAEPFPADLISLHAVDYTPALRMCLLPHGQAVITEEQGSLILALNHQGRLLHSHIFAQRPADAATLAQELLLSRLSLDNLPGVEPFTGVTLVGDWDADLVSRLRHQTALTVQVVDRLSPTAPPQGVKQQAPLLPRSIFTARAAAASRGRWLRIALIAALALAGAIALGWLHLQKLTTQTADALPQPKCARPQPAGKPCSQP
jgi:hypothetical protein